MTPQDVTRAMRRIESELTRDDGIWWFNWAYLRSRLNVLQAADDGLFMDPDYIRMLDVAFGKYWLLAYSVGQSNPLNLPACWVPSFQERLNPLVRPIQHVVAGLGAHILRDLTLANYEMEADSSAFSILRNKTFSSARWRDYNEVNRVLAVTMEEEVLPELRDEYDSRLIEQLNFLVEPSLNLAGHVSLFGARTDAWDRGNTMQLTSRTPLLGPVLVATEDAFYSNEAAVFARAALLPVVEPVP